MTRRDFFDVPTAQRETSVGPVQLPIFYYDVSVLMAYFLIDRDRADPFLEGTGLSAVLALPGKALAGMAFYQYQDSSIGAYNEVGLAVGVMPEARPGGILPPVTNLLARAKRRKLGFVIIDLPVTTNEADAAGREIWGYPKFVTRIPLRFDRDRFAGQVLDPSTDEPIVSFEGPLGLGIPMPGMDLVLYSHHAGTLLRTVVDVKATARTFWSGRYRVRLGNSQHRMARNLAKLGLSNARPFLLQIARGFQSRLNQGVSMLP